MNDGWVDGWMDGWRDVKTGLRNVLQQSKSIIIQDVMLAKAIHNSVVQNYQVLIQLFT